jgi:predicted Zn-dependent protease with MMP-like domain
VPATDRRSRPDPDVAPRRRRRDRRGRGVRGPLLHPRLPAHRTRAERFDDAVLQSLNTLQSDWGEQLGVIEFASEDVPPSDPAPWETGGVALARCFAADGDLPARVVLYRRPIEGRANGSRELSMIVHEIVVEQLSHLWHKRPGEIDPRLDDD